MKGLKNGIMTEKGKMNNDWIKKYWMEDWVVPPTTTAEGILKGTFDQWQGKRLRYECLASSCNSPNKSWKSNCSTNDREGDGGISSVLYCVFNCYWLNKSQNNLFHQWQRIEEKRKWQRFNEKMGTEISVACEYYWWKYPKRIRSIQTKHWQRFNGKSSMKRWGRRSLLPLSAIGEMILKGSVL